MDAKPDDPLPPAYQRATRVSSNERHWGAKCRFGDPVRLMRMRVGRRCGTRGGGCVGFTSSMRQIAMMLGSSFLGTAATFAAPSADDLAQVTISGHRLE